MAHPDMTGGVPILGIREYLTVHHRGFWGFFGAGNLCGFVAFFGGGNLGPVNIILHQGLAVKNLRSSLKYPIHCSLTNYYHCPDLSNSI